MFKNQAQLFEHVWNTREHVSQVSGKPLYDKGHHRWHWQFAHVLSKGAFPRFKLYEDNIMLMLPDEHEQQEQYEVFLAKKEFLKQLYFQK